MIEVEVALFNSLRKYGTGASSGLEPFRLTLPPGAHVGEVVRRLAIPESEIYVAWRNGQNVMTTFGGTFEDDARLAHGDRIALSGPVPFSKGYGAPVC